MKVHSLEAQLKLVEEENQMLTKSQQEWSSRSAQLLSKYNRIDPAESDRVKSELETTKAQLETLKSEKETIEKTLEEAQAQVKKYEADRQSLVTKTNERGRLAFEFKKKLQESEKKVVEAEKKLSDSEAKLEESENKLKLAEANSAVITYIYLVFYFIFANISFILVC